MSYEECEYLNTLTRTRATMRMQMQRSVQLAGRALLFLAGFLLGLAM